MMNLVLLGILIRVAVIAANSFLLYYVVDMEKRQCNCSDSWLRDYIKIFSSLMIVFMILNLVVPNLQNISKKAALKNKLLALLFVVWNLFSMGYLIVLLTYYYKLNQDPNCDCSVNWKRYVLLYPILFLVPALIIMGVSMFKKISGKK